MSFATPPSATALIVGHPGHELRVFRWLEHAHPVVCVLTDGSGGGSSRVASSFDLLSASGCIPGPVMGTFTDVQLYDLMLRGEIGPVVETTHVLARMLVDRGIGRVVADAYEFYNPTHDLCAVVAALAVAEARSISGTPIQLYDYAVTKAASGDGIVIELSREDVERKIAAAYDFDQLAYDVDQLIATVGREDLAREILRPLPSDLRFPAPPGKPLYEVRGEERVAAGRYSTVLRYEDHFAPFVEALGAALGSPVAVGCAVAT